MGREYGRTSSQLAQFLDFWWIDLLITGRMLDYLNYSVFMSGGTR
jgi:hypothetical protein